MSNNTIIVGCPTRKRTWILPLWKEYLEAAIPAGWDYSFAFVTGADDIETAELLSSWDNTKVIIVDEPETDDVRSWIDTTRYEHLSNIRNTLLEYVRQKNPKYFLSIDSDILIHQYALGNMVNTMNKNDAAGVGGLTYFDPIDPTITNGAMWTNNRCTNFRRLNSPGNYPVDIIMGLKLMSEDGYNVDYSYHRMGEDLGWCRNIKDRGLKLYFDSRIGSKHVMSPKWLEIKDSRVGY